MSDAEMIKRIWKTVDAMDAKLDDALGRLPSIETTQDAHATKLEKHEAKLEKIWNKVLYCSGGFAVTATLLGLYLK